MQLLRRIEAEQLFEPRVQPGSTLGTERVKLQVFKNKNRKQREENYFTEWSLLMQKPMGPQTGSFPSDCL